MNYALLAYKILPFRAESDGGTFLPAAGCIYLMDS